MLFLRGLVALSGFTGEALAFEHSDAIRAGAHAFLLETSRLVQVRYVSFARPAGVALVALLFVYTSGAFASTRGEVLIDDFEAADSCPHWWTFGPLAFQRLAADSAGTEHGTRVLDIEGFAAAPSGTGVYLQQDIGSLRTLRLDVRGYGPGS